MIEAVLTDIEGTTSSLSFVKDVLFPYARARIHDYVMAHERQPTVAAVLEEVRLEMHQPSAPVTDVISQLIAWIDEDRKATPLKTLQGLIWEEGYRNGDFHGHVYPDAVDALQRWQARGIRLYVYSSGSVYAQKLLFGHTEYGDLTGLFGGYFDTLVGHKRQADAYRKIAQSLKLPAERILFLSDIVEELAAARAAGMQTILLDRQRQAAAGLPYTVVTSFNEISI
jgi:enolase-phosphatase E1